MIEGFLFNTIIVVGTVAFAMSGAYKGIRHNLDVLGVIVLGFATALGGGLIRDALILHTPAAFLDIGPSACALLGCTIAMITTVFFKDHRSPFTDPEGKPFLALDAIGLAAFTILGASLGAQAGLNMFGIIMLAAVTGVGGGVIRDLLVCETPLVLKADFYATATIIGGIVYAAMLTAGYQGPVLNGAAFATTLVLRTLAIMMKWQLPKF